MAFVAAIVATFVVLQGIFLVKTLKKTFPSIKKNRWYKLAEVYCHVGPVVTFIIVSIVVYFVKILELNFDMKSGTTRWAPIIHSCFAVYIWVNVTFNYFAAVVVRPGRPPKREELVDDNVGNLPDGLDFCGSCDRLRTYGTNHCKNCGDCIRMMCHHSFIVNNCIGIANFSYFFCFLVYGFIGLVYSFYMTYAPFHGCYVHDHQTSSVTLKYPALSFKVCQHVGELPLLFIAVAIAGGLIGCTLLLHCTLLAADLSLVSFICHIQESEAIIPTLRCLFKKCIRKQRRVKFNVLLKTCKRSWKYFLFPSFNLEIDDLSIDDLFDDDQCFVQMV